MGLWYETCMISNLPILINEEVFAVVLAKTEVNNGCYATDSWVPVIAAHGKYDGYANICCPNPNEDTMYEGITAEYNNWKDYSYQQLFDKNDKAGKEIFFEGFLQAVNDGAFFSASTGDMELATVFIKESILSALRQTDSLQKHLKRFWRMKEPYKEVFFDKGKSHLEIYSSFNSTFRNVHALSPEIFIAMFNTDYDATWDIIENLILINAALGELRKSWHIPSGRGSQSLVAESTKVLNETIAKEIKRLERLESENN